MWIEMILQICFNFRQIIPIHPKLPSQVPFNVALKNKTSEDVSLLVIDSIVDGNEHDAEYDYKIFEYF